MSNIFKSDFEEPKPPDQAKQIVVTNQVTDSGEVKDSNLRVKRDLIEPVPEVDQTNAQPIEREKTSVSVNIGPKESYSATVSRTVASRFEFFKDRKAIELRSNASADSISTDRFVKVEADGDFECHTIQLFAFNNPVSKIVPAFKLSKISIVNLMNDAAMNVFESLNVDSGLINPSQIEVITGASREMFSLGTGYVVVVPNEEFFEGSGIKFQSGVPMSEALFSKLTSQNAARFATLDRIKVASGYIIFALQFALRTNVCLVVDSENSTELARDLNYSRPISFVQGRKLVLPVNPHVAFCEGGTLMKFLENNLAEKYREGVVYKYGREDVIVRTHDGGPIVERTYVNIDNVTAQAMAVTHRVMKTDQYNDIVVTRALEAYAIPGSTIELLMIDEAERLYGRLTTSGQELSYLLMGAALSREVYRSILRVNKDAFLTFGTVQPSSTDHLSDLQPDPGNTEILRLIRERKSSASFDTFIEYLVMQVTPSLIWPSVPSSLFQISGLPLFVHLVENILFFVFFPSLAKKCAAGLCNRFYSLVQAIAPEEWDAFVTRVGYDSTPSNSNVISDDEFWENQRRPALLTDVNLNDYPLLKLIRSLIQPTGELHEHTLADRADFPRVRSRSQYWNPYPNPGTQHNETTRFKNRLMLVFNQVYEKILYYNRNGTLISKTLLSGMTKVFDGIKIAIFHHGVGFGRDIGMPLAYLRNRKVNFMSDYDGNLNTEFEYPLYIVSSSEGNNGPMLPIELRRKDQMILETGVVWTALLNLKFPSMAFIDDQTKTPICRFVAPNPGEELMKDEEIIAACANACVPFGIATKIIREMGTDGGMAEIRRLLGVERLSAKDFRNLVHCVQEQTEGMRFYVGRSKNVFHQDEHIDIRCIDPVVRRVKHRTNIEEPNRQDPPIIRGELDLIPPGLLPRFKLGLTAIADERSEYSRLNRGLYICRREVDIESPLDPLPMPVGNWHNVVYTNELFESRLMQHKHQLGILFNGNFISRPVDVPNLIIEVNNTELIGIPQQQFLVECVKERTVIIHLPKIFYLSNIACIHSVQRPDDSVEIARLLGSRNDQIPSITFYDTEQVDPTVRFSGFSSGSISRYIWPEGDITRNVVVRALSGGGATEPIGFQGPTDDMCDTGSIDHGGNVLTTGGAVKDPRRISLTNGIFNFTKRANLEGKLQYRYRASSGLDRY
ncbi:major core capsid [Taro reovirus 1]|nr:major core capsid [Taro reovirus 1]